MLTGDFNMNSVQSYTTVMEVLKQTMLQHEAIFRRQVHELHRLYRMQKTLMETPILFQDPPEYKRLEEERAFSTWSMVEENQGTYPSPQQRPLDHQLTANNYINHVGMELPHKGDLWVSLKESLKVKNFLGNNHISEPEEVHLSLSTGKDTNENGSTRGASYNKQSCLPTTDAIDLEKSIGWVLNETRPVSSINSEAPVTYDKDEHGLLIPSSSDASFSGRTRKDPGHRIFTNHSPEDWSESFQEWRSFSLDTGLNECHGCSSSVKLFSRKQQSTSYDTTDLDLNRVQLDESSCLSDVLAGAFPSPEASSSGVLQGIADESHKGTRTVAAWWRKPDNSFSNESSGLLQQDNSVYSTLTDSREKCTSTQAFARSTNFKENSGSKVGLIDLESVPEDPCELCEDFGSQGIKPREENVDMSLGKQCAFPSDTQMNGSDVILSSTLEKKLDASLGGTNLLQTAGNVEFGKVSCEKSEEETGSSSPYRSCAVVQTAHYEEFHAASILDCVTDNNLSNINDLQLGTEDKQELRDSNLSALECGTTQLRSRCRETYSCEHDPIMVASFCACLQEKSCNLFNIKDVDCDEPQQETTEMDEIIYGAAETLTHISLENSASSRDLFASAGSEELAIEQGSKQPQFSSDSFESIVLRLKESSVDENTVTSGLIEVKETDDGSGLKLRRGRRLKDFQRDILPGIVSLSRHEICEDMHSIGGVIKSNKFRKNRSKMVSGENWCAPIRSRRSRLYYVG